MRCGRCATGGALCNLGRFGEGGVGSFGLGALSLRALWRSCSLADGGCSPSEASGVLKLDEESVASPWVGGSGSDETLL